jgi:uncharacterized protein YhhL (DUF1145 family)
VSYFHHLFDDVLACILLLRLCLSVEETDDVVFDDEVVVLEVLLESFELLVVFCQLHEANNNRAIKDKIFLFFIFILLRIIKYLYYKRNI